MFKEYKFETAAKAIEKKRKMRLEYGFNMPIYKIQMPSGKQWFSIVHPVGLQPNPRRKRYG